MPEPLRNTEPGDRCVTHGGVWGPAESDLVYSDSVGADVEDPWPICSEVSEGYASASDMCRFVSPEGGEG